MYCKSTAILEYRCAKIGGKCRKIDILCKKDRTEHS